MNSPRHMQEAYLKRRGLAEDRGASGTCSTCCSTCCAANSAAIPTWVANKDLVELERQNAQECTDARAHAKPGTHTKASSHKRIDIKITKHPHTHTHTYTTHSASTSISLLNKITDIQTMTRIHTKSMAGKTHEFT